MGLLAAYLEAALVLVLTRRKRPADPLPAFVLGNRLVAGAALGPDGHLLFDHRQARADAPGRLRTVRADRSDGVAVHHGNVEHWMPQFHGGRRVYTPASRATGNISSAHGHGRRLPYVRSARSRGGGHLVLQGRWRPRAPGCALAKYDAALCARLEPGDGVRALAHPLSRYELHPGTIAAVHFLFDADHVYPRSVPALSTAFLAPGLQSHLVGIGAGSPARAQRAMAAALQCRSQRVVRVGADGAGRRRPEEAGAQPGVLDLTWLPSPSSMWT